MPAYKKKLVIFIFLITIVAVVWCPSSAYAQTDYRGLDVVAAPIAGSEAVGKQYAVFIAIDRYKEWPPLKNAVPDAERMRTVLEKRYYIDQVFTLYDEAATKEAVMKLFENLTNELRPEDSLFVFYAGHGVMDPLTRIGSWILQDGGTNRYEQKGWLDNPKIRSLLSTIRSRHVLLVSDSCFSGDILNIERGSQIEITDEYFKKAYARRSRQVLTSGASEKVPDESAFTRSLIRFFEENTKPYLDPIMLFNEIRLTQDLTTSPLLGTLKDSDSQEGGSFIFFLKQQPMQAKVQYYPNGATMGAVPVDGGLYSPGATAKVLSPGSLSKSGYEFAGWNTKPDGTGTDVAAGNYLTIKDADVRLYARWVPVAKQYRVFYFSNGATSGAVPVASNNYLEGDTVTVLGNTGSLSKTGYSFAGWNTKSDGSGTSYQVGSTFKMGSSNVSLYAKWTIPSYVLFATGWNNWGQLGDGTKIDRLKAVKVMENVQSVSAGIYHTMILKNDGSLWAIGYNKYGQLGDGTNINKEAPVKVMENVQSVSVGYNHTMILKSDGSLWATGYNGYGQLGDGTNSNRSTPVKVMKNVQSVSVAHYHTMILKSDGSLWATGYNSYGQLGDGTKIDRSTPVKVMENVQSVSAGYCHTMILKNDGSLWATGYNGSGQLGDGTNNIIRLTAVKVMENVHSVSAGGYHTMILKNDGSLWATGRNDYGQLGDGTNSSRSTPIKVMENVQSVSAGEYHTMILKNDGSLWATGNNSFGELGDGTNNSKSTPVKVMENVQSVSAGYNHTMILH